MKVNMTTVFCAPSAIVDNFFFAVWHDVYSSFAIRDMYIKMSLMAESDQRTTGSGSNSAICTQKMRPHASAAPKFICTQRICAQLVVTQSSLEASDSVSSPNSSLSLGISS